MAASRFSVIPAIGLSLLLCGSACAQTAVPYAGHSFAFETPSASLNGSPPTIEWTADPQWVSPIQLRPMLTQQLMDFQNRQSDKELLLLDPAFNTWTGAPRLTLGAQFRASAMIGKTNTADKFSYLGRFPTDFSGTTVTDARLLQANQSFAASVAPGVHGYMETLFSDVFTFDDPKQGSFQVRQAYVVLGDLSQSPWYAFGGKKNVSLGDLGTLSPFTQAMPWHYFAPLAEGIGAGYAEQGLNVSVTALNGSRGIRVADSEERGHLNNFAVNALQTIPLGSDSELSLGAGYLHGTIYDGPTAEHLDSTVSGDRNGLFDVNAKLRIGRWQLKGEYLQTEDVWPTTNHRVIAYAAEAAVDVSMMGTPVRLSGSWSEGIQGPETSEFEFNRQLVIGARFDPRPNVMLSVEYVRSSGFAPLIGITTVSDKSVVQDSVVFGLVLSI